MRPFKYTTVGDPAAAISQILKNPKAKFLGGGTNLLDLMKEDVTQPDELIDLSKLALTAIMPIQTGSHKGGVFLGALGKNTDAANHPLIRKNFPLLSKAILSGASAQIRNMATNAGNLLQRTRCSYFYDVNMPCNKRSPGSGCSALEGFNRMHAIFGWSENCIAVYPSDMAIALSALDARVKVLQSSGQTKYIHIKDFHLLPGAHPERENVLEASDLIVAIELPKNNFAEHSAYIKVRDRNSYAFALVSVAVGLHIEGKTIRSAKISLGGVAHKPWPALHAEEELKGKPATMESFVKAAMAEVSYAKPLSHNKFKVEMTKRTIISALQLATQGTGAKV